MELLESTVGDYRQNLHLLLVAVGCVLLIACANVTNLQLARALARGKELAVRAAMGASRWRLMRLMLIESAILGVIGGVAGLLIAVWSLDAIHALSPPNVPRFQETRLDFARRSPSLPAIALLCGILVGIWPAWRVSRLVSLSGVLHEAGSRGGSDSGDRQRARGFLVVTQVALALVLLAGAGLTLRSFWNSENAPLGFEPNDVLTMTLALPEARYDSNEKVANFLQATDRARRSAPRRRRGRDRRERAVRQHGMGQLLPSHRHAAGATRPRAVGGGQRYLAGLLQGAADCRSLRGARFRIRERNRQTRSPRSVIIDDVLAQKFFAGKNPIGQHIDDNQTTRRIRRRSRSSAWSRMSARMCRAKPSTG